MACFLPICIATLFVSIITSPLLAEGRRRATCDRSLLSICYNQLQPFFLTNNLRLVLRGVLQNAQHRQSPVTIAGNKHGRSQSPSSLPLPLHRIYAEFREFCELYSTFAECLDAHGAADCLEADVIGELDKAALVTVARRDRSNNGINYLQQSPADLIRDFDHYRRLANSYCVETSENMRIHIVRCIAHAIASSSLTLDDHKGATWVDAQLMHVDGSATSLNAGSTAATCLRWLRQSQAPLIQSFFRQEGCGEHLQSAIRLSAFLAELTVRTTNATDAASSPKYGVCVRHLPPKIFESLINETFYNLVTPDEQQNTQPVTTQPTSTIGRVIVNNVKEPVTVEELLSGNNKQSTFPILSVEETNNRPNSETGDYPPWLQLNSNKPLSESSDNDDGGEDYDLPTKQSRLGGVVIPMTVDSDNSIISNNNNNNELSDGAVGYDDDGNVLGVSLMMADSPLGINEPSADNQRLNDALSSSPPRNIILTCFVIIQLLVY